MGRIRIQRPAGNGGDPSLCPFGSAYAQDARAWLEGVALLPLDDSILDQAASLVPPTLRTLDAVHLATVLSVRDEIGVLFTYDDRLATAAAGYQLPVAGFPASEDA